MKTEPGVFIIESLEFEDENNNFFEGQVIGQILDFSGVPHEYYYIRTKRELEVITDVFAKSKLRYLHISCHGSKSSLHTTLDEIRFNELGLILNPHLDKRRLFLSACSSVNTHLADQILLQSDCFSIIGPSKDIYFNDAVIFWASFYHLMFKYNSMKRDNLKDSLSKISKLFSVEINYISKSASRGYVSKKYSKSNKKSIPK